MSESKVEMETVELTAETATLENIFNQYMEMMYKGQTLSEEDIKAIKMVFYSGAAGVLGIYEGITSKADEVQTAIEANTDLHGAGHPYVVKLEDELDMCADALDMIMENQMAEVDELLGIEQAQNQSEAPRHCDDLTVVKPEAKDKFDLENWNPTDNGNKQ